MAEKQVIEIIRKFAKAIEKEGIRIDKVVLYGSQLYGTPRAESDIDVAIVSKDFGKDTVEEGMFLFRIAGDIDTRLEPVAISLESFQHDTWVPLIYEIRKKGQEIVSAI